jgi:hypothetical protein
MASTRRIDAESAGEQGGVALTPDLRKGFLLCAFQEIAMAKRVATIASHGDDGSTVEFMVVTVHRGDRVLQSAAFHSEKYASGEEMVRAVFEFARRHKAEELRQVGEVLPTADAYCACCGEIAARVS